MKKHCRLSIILALVAILVFSSSAFALYSATKVSWSSAGFRPSSGTTLGSEYSWNVSQIGFSAANKTYWQNSWAQDMGNILELECRPYNKSGGWEVMPSQIWSYKSFSTNWNDAYPEFEPKDQNDIAVGLRNLQNISTSQYYYAGMSLQGLMSNFNATYNYIFELEKCRGALKFPLEYAQYGNGSKMNFGTSFNW